MISNNALRIYYNLASSILIFLAFYYFNPWKGQIPGKIIFIIIFYWFAALLWFTGWLVANDKRKEVALGNYHEKYSPGWIRFYAISSFVAGCIAFLIGTLGLMSLLIETGVV